MLAELADEVVTVSEENLSRGLLLSLERAKQLVEPAGVAGVAALLEHSPLFEPPAVIILSGGNIDPLLLAKVLRHGLAAAGRYLAFRCRLTDRPGALATLLGELAGLGANVLDVVHARVTADLRVDEAEVLLQVEARGPEHCDSVIEPAAQGRLHGAVQLSAPAAARHCPQPGAGGRPGSGSRARPSARGYQLGG